MSFRFGDNDEDGEADDSPRGSGAHGKPLTHLKRKSFVTQETKTEKEFPAESSYKKEAKERALGITIDVEEDGITTPRMDPNNQFAETEVIGIISINAAGDILFSNQKAQDILNCPELTGRQIHDFTPNNYFGTDDFRTRHAYMIRSFFDRPFAGGRVLDPGTILRARLEDGRMVPLNIGLESKLNFKTGKPKMVVAYITEAAGIIDQSKVEKMLARATLVVLQQFLSQTILSAVSGYELSTIPTLDYHRSDDYTLQLTHCKNYSYKKLSADGENGGQDYKMLLYVMSTAFTIIISVLPLFVNHMHDNDKDEGKVKRWTRKEIIKYLANSINDVQERLSSVKVFREYDIVSITILVTISNLFLLYQLKMQPNEYELNTVKECEDKVKIEKTITAVMSILGGIPFVYFVIKYTFIGLVYGFETKTTHSPDDEDSDDDEEASKKKPAGHAGHSGKNMRKKSTSRRSFRTSRTSSSLEDSEMGGAGGCPFLSGGGAMDPTMMMSNLPSNMPPLYEGGSVDDSFVLTGSNLQHHSSAHMTTLSEGGGDEESGGDNTAVETQAQRSLDMKMSDIVDVEQ
jgi:PAS domain-containing protein